MRQRALILALVALTGGCSEFRYASPTPGPDAVDGGAEAGRAPSDASAEATVGDAAIAEHDRESAMWPLPAPSPANADYSVTAEAVHDDRTNLDWERVTSLTPSSWEDARARCEALAGGGHDDWRLPTRIELLTLVDYGAVAPSFNAVVFAPAAEGGVFWSATPDARTPEAAAWTVAFGVGESASLGRTESARSRCVRGDSPARAHYVTSSDAVTDLFTGLRWQRHVAQTAPATWTDALLLCQNARTSGLSGWRLPTARELESIVDVRVPTTPTLRAEVFATDDPGVVFWSITSVAKTNDARAWAVNFTAAHPATTLDARGADTAFVRCVSNL